MYEPVRAQLGREEASIRIEQRSHAGARLVPGAGPAGATTMRAALSARVVRGRATADLAGVAAAVGKDVTALRPGDEVFGQSTAGTRAESACVPADNLLSVPANCRSWTRQRCPPRPRRRCRRCTRSRSFDRARRCWSRARRGGVGSFAVQIAKAFGAEETGVCSTRNVDESADALRYVAAGHTRGKVVVTV